MPLIKLFLKPIGKQFYKRSSARLRDGIQKRFGRKIKEGQIPVDLMRKLIESYEPYSLALEHMTGRSLDDWRG